MKILRYFIVGASGEEPTYQCQRHKRCGFNPWVGKIPWRREWLATHSSILAWRAPWTVEPGRLQFMGLQRGRHNWSDLAHTHTWSVLLGDQSSQMKNSFFFIYNVLISHPIEYILWPTRRTEMKFPSPFFGLFSSERHQSHFSRQSKVWRLLLTQEADTYGGRVTFGHFSTMKAKAMFLATPDFCPTHPCYK